MWQNLKTPNFTELKIWQKKLKYLSVTKLKLLNCVKTYKLKLREGRRKKRLKLWQNSITKIEKKTQKLKFLRNSKILIESKLINLNCNKTEKLELGQNST